MEKTKQEHQNGTNPNNDMKNQNGQDEIDLWAEKTGKHERRLNGMRPKRKHALCGV